MYVCFAWRLWNVRNDRVWNDNSVDVLYLFSQVQAYVQEWWFVNDKYNVSKKSHGAKVNSWNAPDPNKWKFNVYAATFKETNMFGWVVSSEIIWMKCKQQYQMFILEVEI